MLRIPVHTCTCPGLPVAARALCWKSGLLVMVCGGGSVDTGPPPTPWEPVKGACTHGHSGLQATSGPPPSPSATWACPGYVCCGHVAGQVTETGSAPGHFCPVFPSNPEYTFFKTDFDTACTYLFLFCLLFNSLKQL